MQSQQSLTYFSPNASNGQFTSTKQLNLTVEFSRVGVGVADVNWP